jgi:hypothetical protein
VATKRPKKPTKKKTPAASASPGVSPIPPSDSALKTTNPVGRPTLYDPNKHPAQVFALTGKLGADVSQVAEILNVAPSTIYLWMNEHPEFMEAINRGRELYDNINVEGTLLKRALGYTAEEQTFEHQEVIGEDGKPTNETRRVLVRTVTKHIVPDTKAITTWLGNRMPERWRINKFEGELDLTLSGLMGKQEGLVVDLSQLSRDDAESLRTIIEAATVGSRELSSGSGKKA